MIRYDEKARKENNAKLTQEQKMDIYKNGSYSCSPPDVYTGNWDDNSWVKWIDSHGWFVTP